MSLLYYLLLIAITPKNYFCVLVSSENFEHNSGVAFIVNVILLSNIDVQYCTNWLKKWLEQIILNNCENYTLSVCYLLRLKRCAALDENIIMLCSRKSIDVSNAMVFLLCNLSHHAILNAHRKKDYVRSRFRLLYS